MRTNTAIKTFMAAAVLAILASGCAGGTSSTSGNQAAPAEAQTGSVADFVSLASKDVHVDYTPLTSPADAVRRSDLIVKGTLVEVVDGITVQYDNQAMTQREAGSYATFVVKVDQVLAGRARGVADGHVYVSVYKSSTVSPQQLAKLNPDAQTVLVLDDITAWTPQPNAKVVRPAAIPAGASLYAPFNDGLWLQGAQDKKMHGIGVESSELAAQWGAPNTIGQFADAISKAAKR
jgi:hypothetical protein